MHTVFEQSVADSAASTTQSKLTHHMPFGAELVAPGAVRFSLWAPAAEHVAVELEGESEPLSLRKTGNGWHEVVTPRAGAGSRYRFLLSDLHRVPDPASRFQPEDVHGWSEVIDGGSYEWHDGKWQGRLWTEAVIYELHVGTFTPEGTFLAVIEKLQHLVNLGVTAIQLMPVADFAGRRNWGYDGVLPYAPDSAYGRPEDFKALVEAAHLGGLMVLLDVVYNHFGPDGNYLPLYAPQIFTDRHKTPWGDAVNYDSEGSLTVRQFAIHNAFYWLEEFHLDGLRLDAVHQIKDQSQEHLLHEMARRIRAKDWGRPIHLILENELNEAERLRRGKPGEPLEFTAQWNDDIHHVLHTAATLENHSYYNDYAGNTDMLGRAMAEGFAFQGERMETLGRERGEPSGQLSPVAFVAFIQNHDQVGNRAFGDRISTIASIETVRAMAATYLLLPQIPMLFMGEEWGTRKPFTFFCDFPGELGLMVRKGRREEFSALPEFQDPEQRERIPDPGADETFTSSRLEWDELALPENAACLAWYTRILQVRRDEIVPLLGQIGPHAGRFEVLAPGAVRVGWMVQEKRQLTFTANLSKESVEGVFPTKGRTLWTEGVPGNENRMEPWSLRWALEEEQA